MWKDTKSTRILHRMFDEIVSQVSLELGGEFLMSWSTLLPAGATDRRLSCAVCLASRSSKRTFCTPSCKTFSLLVYAGSPSVAL